MYTPVAETGNKSGNIDRESGEIGTERQSIIDETSAFFSGNMNKLMENADTGDEKEWARKVSETATPFIETIKGKLVKMVESYKDQNVDLVKLEEEFSQVDDILDQYGTTINENLGKLVNEIAAASSEQEQGLGQINTAISQMDTVTQTTAANSEESASTSEELTSQATELNSMVDALVALVGGGNGKGNGRKAVAHAIARNHGTVLEPAGMHIIRYPESFSNRRRNLKAGLSILMMSSRWKRVSLKHSKTDCFLLHTKEGGSLLPLFLWCARQDVPTWRWKSSTGPTEGSLG